MDFANLTAPEAASALLKQAQGIQRNAEVKAWEQANRYTPDSDGRRYWVQVVIAIVERTEIPAVQRTEFVPTPAFAPAAA